MVDLDSYAEPLSAMRQPVPLATVYSFRLRSATAWQWRTVPAEAVSEHFAISPSDPYDWRDLSLTSSYTTRWVITHTPSGLRAASAEFLPWGREWANRAETFFDWSAPDFQDRHPAGQFPELDHEISGLEHEFYARYMQLGELCDSPSRAERQRAYRQLRRLGAEYQPPSRLGEHQETG